VSLDGNMGLREPLQESNPSSTDALARAGEALVRRSWQEARELFETSLSEQVTPEALEGLGVAASWLDDSETSDNVRERAYRAYRERGDRLEAARVAMSIAMTHIGFMGAPAVARGWLRRAKGLLEDLEPTSIHGWIALGEGFIAVVYDKEAETGRELSEEAAKLGRSLDDVHLEMMATGQSGLCMVLAGDVKGGMPLLDEAVAAAIGGELTDPSVITNTCCYMITACQRVRDYDRAAQWARKTMDYCRNWTDKSTFSYCRSEGAATLIWQGKWAEAEHELRSTLSELGGSKPSIGAMASARLADLRRRQGRFDDARALLDEIGSEPLRGAFGPDILLSQALLALDRGDHAGASDLAERYLRRVPREVPTERLDAVAAFALARLRAGDSARVEGALVELKEVAEGLDTEAVRATAEFTRGVAALTSGELDAARRSLEDAVDLYERSGGIQESGRARLELARVLGQLERPDAAEHEARLALRALSTLGAMADAEEAEKVLKRLGAVPGRRTEGGAVLTDREAEILHSIGQGLSNQEIASALFLSVRTVERHISNIYAKVGAHGKAARAAAAAYAHTHGLV
jgi:DNA-binding CsgD family transcriptional regulator/predicted negative regulator of RcsB-dependent stress response